MTYSSFVRYDRSVFQGPTSRTHDFVVRCKGCSENIAVRLLTMPDDWVIEACPFCAERSRYLPQEIFQGRLSHKYASLTVHRGH